MSTTARRRGDTFLQVATRGHASPYRRYMFIVWRRTVVSLMWYPRLIG